MHSFLSLLQFADGLFPAGAYAHSFGLESYVQSGGVTDAAGVEAFLRSYLEGSVAPTDAVALLCASRAAKAADLTTCLALDETLDAMKAASELRDASRQMGRQTMRVANHLPGHALLAGILRSSCERRHAWASSGDFRNDWRRDDVARAGNGKRLSVVNKRGSGWRGPPAHAAGATCRPAHSVRHVKPLIAKLAEDAQRQDSRPTCGPSLRHSRSRACVTPCSKRGYFDHDSETGQDRYWWSRGIGENCVGRIALHTVEAEPSTGSDHQ